MPILKIGSRVARVLHDWSTLGRWLLAFLVLFALPCLLLPAGSDRVQWQGMLFQWAGVIIVAWGLTDTRRRLFHKAPLREEIWNRVRRLSHIIKPPPQNIAPAAFIEPDRFYPPHHVRNRRNVAGTLEERVTALTENQRQMDEELLRLHQDAARVEKETAERIENERRERQSAEQSIRQLIESAIIGGIHLELSGVAYLLVGILFTSVPNFVAVVLQKVVGLTLTLCSMSFGLL